MQQRRSKIITTVAIVILVILTLPIFVYIHTFGLRISDQPEVWSAMGSAMSGIYGPVLAMFTLVLLALQFWLQRMQFQLQQSTNKHAEDQAYLLNAKEDIDFYLEQLVKVLEKSGSTLGSTVKGELRAKFERKTAEQLSAAFVWGDARDLNRHAAQLQSIWMAIYSIYDGLLANQGDAKYRMHFTSAKLKTIAMLSMGTCVALDNYVYCMTQGKSRSLYQFSSELLPHSGSPVSPTTA